MQTVDWITLVIFVITILIVDKYSYKRGYSTAIKDCLEILETVLQRKQQEAKLKKLKGGTHAKEELNEETVS